MDEAALRAYGLSDADIADLMNWSPSGLVPSASWQTANDAARSAAQSSGVSNVDMYVPRYGGGDIIPGTTDLIFSKLGLDNPYLPVFRTLGSENSGNPIDATERSTFAVDPSGQYRLVDNRTGDVVGTASNPTDLRTLVESANALSASQGKKADWALQQSGLYSADPNAPMQQTWGDIAHDDPNTTPLSIKAMMAAMAAMTGAGVLQGLGTAGAGAASAAAPVAEVGSLAPGALASLPANLAAISTGANAALGAAGLGAGLSAAAPALAAAAPAIGEAAPIIVTAGGAGLGAPAIAGGLAAAGTGAAALSGGTGASAPTTAAPSTSTPSPPATTTGPELVVTAPKNILPATIGGGALGATGAVTASEVLSNAAATNAAGATSPLENPNVTGMTPEEVASVNAGAGGGLLGNLTADQILAYSKLAGLGVGAIGSLFGGGAKSGAAGTIPAGLNGGLDPIFSAKLPTGPASIPGGVGAAANFAARPQTEQDWLTYGQRPEQSFFNYVPQPTGMAHGGSFAAKHGGASPRTSFAVHGPGTGRSDDIPAVLSDGEYVMDAETVALLGDGSSKAGAQKLDDLRVKIRKHKGQKLAQGRFSANAKHPEAYLSGGRI